jgi:hypothetical protein
MKRLLLAITLSLPLAACASKPAEAPPAASAYGPLVLDVGSIDIVAQPGAADGGTAERAVRDWARQRLAATARSGDRARLTISEARVTEKELVHQGGVTGLFKDEDAFEYDGRIEVRLDIFPAGGGAPSWASASADRQLVMPESSSPASREAALAGMMENMKSDLDNAFQQAARRNLSRWVNR